MQWRVKVTILRAMLMLETAYRSERMTGTVDTVADDAVDIVDAAPVRVSLKYL